MARIVTFDIPNDELESVDDQMFKVLGMSRDDVIEQFEDEYEDTRPIAFDRLECRGMVKYVQIESIDEGIIKLEDGGEFYSEFLSDRLSCADELALYIVSVFGGNELMKEAQDDMFATMFYNAWATGLSMSGHGWIKKQIANDARERGKFSGRGWVPGDGQVGLELFKTLVKIIDPSPIGVKLLETGMVSPIMSLCALMGISDDPAIEEVGRDDIEIH